MAHGQKRGFLSRLFGTGEHGVPRREEHHGDEHGIPRREEHHEERGLFGGMGEHGGEHGVPRRDEHHGERHH